jgi:hypothetical protein
MNSLLQHSQLSQLLFSTLSTLILIFSLLFYFFFSTSSQLTILPLFRFAIKKWLDRNSNIQRRSPSPSPSPTPEGLNTCCTRNPFFACDLATIDDARLHAPACTGDRIRSIQPTRLSSGRQAEPRRSPRAEEEVARAKVQHLVLQPQAWQSSKQAAADRQCTYLPTLEFQSSRDMRKSLIRFVVRLGAPTLERVLVEVQLEAVGRRAGERRAAALAGVGGDGGAHEVGDGGVGAQHEVDGPQAAVHRHVHQQPRQPPVVPVHVAVRRRAERRQRLHALLQQPAVGLDHLWLASSVHRRQRLGGAAAADRHGGRLARSCSCRWCGAGWR